MHRWDEPDPPSHYKAAAICRRGHVEARNIEDTVISERCPKCGAEILTSCPGCGARIRGYHWIPGVAHGSYTRPQFCDSCGRPFPWLDRPGRIYELENLLATRSWTQRTS